MAKLCSRSIRLRHVVRVGVKVLVLFRNDEIIITEKEQCIGAGFGGVLYVYFSP